MPKDDTPSVLATTVGARGSWARLKSIELTRGKVALVDDDDYEWLLAFGRWHAQVTRKGWYAACSRQGTTVYMHRVIIGAAKGEQVDHADGDGLHNWRSNLRLATQSQNNANARTRTGPKSSHFKGVYWFKHPRAKAGGYWKAQLSVEGRIFVRYAATEELAAAAYNALALEHYGEWARLNVI